jgi:hypothetical protein
MIELKMRMGRLANELPTASYTILSLRVNRRQQNSRFF